MKKRTSGFTLIELVIAMAVVTIGLSLTIPAMRDFTDTNRQAEQINKLVRDITLAKSEAVTRGETICVTQGPPGGPATPIWDGGWFVHDTAVPANNTLRSATTVAIADQVLSSAGGFTSVCFRPDGSIAADFTVEQCKTCFFADNLPNEKQITVGVTGRITLDSRFRCPATPVCP